MIHIFKSGNVSYATYRFHFCYLLVLIVCANLKILSRVIDESFHATCNYQGVRDEYTRIRMYRHQRPV